MERVYPILFKTLIIWSLMLMSTSYSNGTMTDIHCLRSIKQSVEDPSNSLSTWVFNNLTEGAVCRFTGVDCWSSEENKVLNIRLSNMGLKGQFPMGIQNCTSLTGLDLSRNEFSGPIPSDIPKIIPFITNLNLSFNRFSSKIPESLSNCTYLMVLNLQNNQFYGQIPQELGLLTRLGRINFANNFLSGQVPTFVNQPFVTREAYANNTALCGGPLESCTENDFKNSFLVGFMVGWAIFTALVITAFMFYSLPMDKNRGKNMKLTMPMTRALMIRRENKYKKKVTQMREFPIAEPGRDEIIEEMDS